MREYVKPIIVISEEAAEGVYAASGAVSGGVTVTKGNESWGQNHFTLTILPEYLAKHVKISGVSNKTITDCWTGATLSYSGTTFTIETWSAPSTFDLVLKCANDESMEVLSASIEIVE